MATWRDEETTKLTQLWSEECVQEQLEGCTRKRAIIKKISWTLQLLEFEGREDNVMTGLKSLKKTIKKQRITTVKPGEVEKNGSTTKF